MMLIIDACGCQCDDSWQTRFAKPQYTMNASELGSKNIAGMKYETMNYASKNKSDV